jgi:hypothetical protein
MSHLAHLAAAPYKQVRRLHGQRCLQKHKQFKLNRRCLLIYDLPVVVLFTMLKYVTFKIKQTLQSDAECQTLDGQTDPLPAVQKINVVKHEHVDVLQQKLHTATYTNKMVEFH